MCKLLLNYDNTFKIQNCGEAIKMVEWKQKQEWELNEFKNKKDYRIENIMKKCNYRGLSYVLKGDISALSADYSPEGVLDVGLKVQLNFIRAIKNQYVGKGDFPLGLFLEELSELEDKIKFEMET